MSHGTQDVRVPLEVVSRGVRGVPLIESDDRAGKNIGFFNDWAQHVERDVYWQQIDGEDRAAKVDAAVLLMGGWYDPFLPTQLADYSRIRAGALPRRASECRLIIGPWGHAFAVTPPGGDVPRNYRLESLGPCLAWFDRHLRQAPGKNLAPVKIFVMGRNQWRDEQEWPLARTRYAPLYLRSLMGMPTQLRGTGGSTSRSPETEDLPDHFTYDPSDPVP